MEKLLTMILQHSHSWILPVFALLILVGCSQQPKDSDKETLVVVLDYLPGPIHAGLYAAEARGEFAAAGLEVILRTPSSTSDTIRLMAAGQADLGLAPLLDFLHIHSEKRPFHLLMALVQTPLNAVMTSEASGIRRPRDLEGKTIATTGIIGDEVLMKAVIRADGGNPDTVEAIGVGFNTIQTLSAGKVDAAFGFWSSEGVQYAKNHPAVILRSFEHGVPAYPEIVLFGNTKRIEERKEAIGKFMEITAASYERLLNDPEEALALFAQSVDGYDVESARPYYEVLLPVFQYQSSKYGAINPAELTEVMRWLADNGLPEYQFPVETLIDSELTLQP